jgi:hypothetical protein
MPNCFSGRLSPAAGCFSSRFTRVMKDERENEASLLPGIIAETEE